MLLETFVKTRGCPSCSNQMWLLTANKEYYMICSKCKNEWEPVVKDRNEGVTGLLSLTAHVVKRIHECPVILFRGPYAFLGNFFTFDMVYKGLPYTSSEAAYQAQKCRHEEDKIRISSMSSVDAKREGSKVPIVDNWDNIKLEIMEDILRVKFSDKTMRELLYGTAPSALMEGNIYKDDFWGVRSDTMLGENHLGTILMKIRDEKRD